MFFVFISEITRNIKFVDVVVLLYSEYILSLFLDIPKFGL